MRKRTLRTLLSVVAGALLGGLAVFTILAQLGRESPEASAPLAIPLSTPRAATPTPLPASPAPSPTATPGAGEIRVEALGVSFVLPQGYRVATALNAQGEGKHPAQFTVTKASAAAEQEYLAAVREISGGPYGGTDAPTFAPGTTITLHETTTPDPEKGDAPFARGKEGVQTARGLVGTRFRRVESIGTYDMTYLLLPSGKKIGVEMFYSTAEPRFDEGAYQALLDSLRPR